MLAMRQSLYLYTYSTPITMQSIRIATPCLPTGVGATKLYSTVLNLVYFEGAQA